MLAHLAEIFVLLIVGLVFVQPALAKPMPYAPITLSAAIAHEKADPVPPQFDIDKVGKPFAIIHYLPIKRVREVCAAIPGYVVYACSWGTDVGHSAYPSIVIDANTSPEVRKIMLHHEYAHVLGWRH